LIWLLFASAGCDEDAAPLSVDSAADSNADNGSSDTTTDPEVDDDRDIDGDRGTDGDLPDRADAARDGGDSADSDARVDLGTDARQTVSVGGSAAVRVSNRFVLVGRTASHLTRSENSQYTLYAGVQ